MRERWEDDSRCLTTTADRLLFAAAFEKTAPVLLVDEARRVCMSCPVASRCLQEALADEQAGGVRGATTEKERRLARQRAKRKRAKREAVSAGRVAEEQSGVPA